MRSRQTHARSGSRRIRLQWERRNPMPVRRLSLLAALLCLAALPAWAETVQLKNGKLIPKGK